MLTSCKTICYEYRVQNREPYIVHHRATVVQRDHLRQRLEKTFGWWPSASYQRLRVYYRRWRYRLDDLLGPALSVIRRDPYAAWVQEEEQLMAAKTAHVARLTKRPVMSVLLVIQAPHLSWLEDSIASVVAQSYPKWELWLCDLSASSSLRSHLEELAARDERIKMTAVARSPQEPTERLNHVLQRSAGEYLVLLAQHDMLPPWALAEIVRQMQDKAAEVLYSDEDSCDAGGSRSAPFCKPDWSPDLSLSSLYACQLSVYRRSLIEAVGGFHSANMECLVYDLLLRCAEKTERIHHIPRVLYHKRQKTVQPRDDMHTQTKQIVSDALRRRGEVAVVEDGPAPCTFRIRRQLRTTPLVSIVIPTRDRLRLLRRCVQSIEERTTYSNYEILIVDNGSQEADTLAYLSASPHRVIHVEGPFHFARLCNGGVALTQGEQILLLNNDMEVITPGWLEALLEHAQRPDVGAVGAKLLYADGTIQHAGVVLGMRGVAGHAHKYQPAKRPGYGDFPQLVRNYSAVTAACLMIRKAVYEEVGGMREELAVLYNDTDLCLRLRERNYLIVYTPYAELYHHEGRSRWYHPPNPEETRYMFDHWGAVIARDPYYNPQLALQREDFHFDQERARSLVERG